jgi:hypothetical protein
LHPWAGVAAALLVVFSIVVLFVVAFRVALAILFGNTEVALIAACIFAVIITFNFLNWGRRLNARDKDN